VQLFETRLARYIALDATGNLVDVEGDGGEVESVPEYAFRAVRARLRGAELDARGRLAERPWTPDLGAGFDTMRGENLDAREPLPRLAPRRLRVSLEAAAGPWRAGVEVRHVAAQDRVPAADTRTPAATIGNLWASGRRAWAAPTRCGSRAPTTPAMRSRSARRRSRRCALSRRCRGGRRRWGCARVSDGACGLAHRTTLHAGATRGQAPSERPCDAYGASRSRTHAPPSSR
jgi:hypothetical protein